MFFLNFLIYNKIFSHNTDKFKSTISNIYNKFWELFDSRTYIFNNI